jgi:hypothetical protein
MLSLPRVVSGRTKGAPPEGELPQSRVIALGR